MRRNQVTPAAAARATDEDKGQKHEGELTGPVANRRCTDFLFFLIFVIFWAGMFIIAGYAGRHGALGRLLYGQDSEGDFCGIDNSRYESTGKDLRNATNLYWPELNNNDYRICVNQCPGSHGHTDNVLSTDQVLLATAVTSTTCDPSLVCPEFPKNSLIEIPNSTLKCCAYVTKGFFYRCLPNYDNTTVNSELDDLFAGIAHNLNFNSNGQKYVADIYKTAEYQVLFAAIAFVLSFFFLFVIRLMSTFLVWLILFLIVGVMAGVTAYLWKYAILSHNVGSAQLEGHHLSSHHTNSTAAKILAYIMIGLTALLIILIFSLRKQIRLAIAVFKEAARCMAALPSLIGVPIVLLLGFIMLMVYWIYILLLLASAVRAEPKYSSNNITSVASASTALSLNNSTNPVEYVRKDLPGVQYLAIYHFFGLLWTSNFLLAIGQITVSGAAATWYFTRDKREVSNGATAVAFYRSIRFHTGSAAFGALIVAIAQFMQYVQQYIASEMENKGQMNPCTEALCCLAACCLACVERFLRFVSKNAFIMVAIYGDSFCAGGRKAFTLILRNVLRVAAANWVGDFLLLLLKLIVTFAVVLVAIGVVQNVEGSSSHYDLSFWIVPVILAAVIAYVIASLFVSVFEMIIETVLICFLEDEERSSSGNVVPYMSDSLRLAIDPDNVRLNPAASKQ